MKLLQTTLVIVMIGIGSSVAAAQNTSAAPEHGYAFGTIGLGGFGGLDSGAPQFGGTLLGGGAGLAQPHGWFIEVVADQLVNYHSSYSTDHGDVTALYGRVGHRWGPPSQGFRPFVAFAVGGAADHWQDSYGADGQEHHAGGALLGAVFGGDFRAGDKFFVRPEASLMVGMGEGFRRASISAGYRF